MAQPEVNIGLVGHVDHGKTTLTERLSGKWTDTHSEELKRGITIRLGYADAAIYELPGVKGDERFTSLPEVDGTRAKEVRRISLIDAPGHESLMATMLAGASLMDGALLLVAANEHCPQPQTVEHLMALEIAGIEKVIVVQNKIDMVSSERAQQHYEQIKDFLSGTRYADAPIIPISALHGVNIDVLLAALEEYIPTPERDLSAAARFFVARSFDVNKPGTAPKDLRGGVLGGAVFSGVFSVGDVIEVRPGRVVEEHNQRVAYPLTTTIASLVTGGDTVDELRPGGSSGMMTTLDPGLVKSDSLVGSMVGRPGDLPPVWHDVELSVQLLDRVVGVEDAGDVQPLRLKELLMLNVHSAATVGVVSDLGKDRVTVSLRKPVCADVGDHVTLSRRVGNRFRLIGYGSVTGGRSDASEHKS